MVRETFPEFCTTSEGIPPSGNVEMNNSRDQYAIIADDNSSLNHNSSSILQNAAKFSDEEDECSASKKPKRNKKDTNDTKDTKNGKKSIKASKESNISSSSSALSKSDLIAQIEQLGNDEMRACLTKLHEDKYVITHELLRFLFKH
jgi:hypothetical protein